MIKKKEIASATYSLNACHPGHGVGQSLWNMTISLKTMIAHTPQFCYSRTGHVPSQPPHQKPKWKSWLMHKTHHPALRQGHCALLNRPCYLLHAGSLFHQKAWVAGEEGEQKSFHNWNCQTHSSCQTDLGIMTNVKEEQTPEFAFPSEGWDKIKMAWREWGRQQSTREEGDVLTITHMAATMSLTFPAKEEPTEQKEEGQFLLHTLPVNSNFTDTFRPACSQPEISPPIPCVGSRGEEHMEMWLVHNSTQHCQSAGSLTPENLTQE